MNWRGGQAPGHSEISSWSQGFSLGQGAYLPLLRHPSLYLDPHTQSAEREEPHLVLFGFTLQELKGFEMWLYLQACPTMCCILPCFPDAPSSCLFPI